MRTASAWATVWKGQDIIQQFDVPQGERLRDTIRQMVAFGAKRESKRFETKELGEYYSVKWKLPELWLSYYLLEDER